ncbi:MAG: nickel pincer cofactor biosynthesis protein LarB [Planctomycetota bacterium]
MRNILRDVQKGKLSPDEAAAKIRAGSFVNIGFARVDVDREDRVGFPEVIFGRRKTAEHVAKIVAVLIKRSDRLLVTHASQEMYDEIIKIAPNAQFERAARAVVIRPRKQQKPKNSIFILTAGTSDIPVAEEARVTAEMFNIRVESAFDCGVAGLHRLMPLLPKLRKARAVIVVAGMDGALPSVVGGLVGRPIIAVPTSVGYGASFEGIGPLLTMLNSCAAGVTVVNIDNGFGAGYFAGLLARA